MHFDNGGKTVEVYLHGDENSHYYTSPDGYMLMRGMTASSAMPFPTGTVCALDIYSHRPNAPKRRRDLAPDLIQQTGPLLHKGKGGRDEGETRQTLQFEDSRRVLPQHLPHKRLAPVHRSTCGIPGCKSSHFPNRRNYSAICSTRRDSAATAPPARPAITSWQVPEASSIPSLTYTAR